MRVDLLGGTLDLNPIHLIIPQVVTLNLATTLKAKVRVEAHDKEGIEIHSKDYKTTHFYKLSDLTETSLRSGLFGPLTFMMWICKEMKVTQGIKIELESGSPPGSGLGGSSAMGATLARALYEYSGGKLDEPRDCVELIKKVNSIEALILDAGPAGYQDYYPALFGGILALRPGFSGISVEQLYNEELAEALESRLTLIHTGDSRNSGVNNWEVYKGFFERDKVIRKGLDAIAKLSFEAYEHIKAKRYDLLIDSISREGEQRKALFPGIVSTSMNSLFKTIKGELPHIGMKVCGAGGGGAFLLIHRSGDRELIRDHVSKSQMEILEFKVDRPLLGDYGA